MTDLITTHLSGIATGVSLALILLGALCILATIRARGVPEVLCFLLMGGILVTFGVLGLPDTPPPPGPIILGGTGELAGRLPVPARLIFGLGAASGFLALLLYVVRRTG